MNIVQKIKLLFQIKKLISFIKTKAKEKVKMNGVKPGIYTTEFWLTVITNLITIITTLKGMIPAETATIILAILNGLYTILRSLVKQPNITTLVEKKE